MEIKLKSWKGNEKLYFYPQSTQIAGQTGQIGRLRADFGSNGNEFWTTWEDKRDYLKTDDFKKEFDEVINYLRFQSTGTPIANRKSLTTFLKTDSESLLPDDGAWHGFRADTDNYSYLFRLKAEKGDYNMYCFCYKKDWLDQHMAQSQNGIRFITPDYEKKFTIADGDKVRVTYEDGTKQELTARYVDDYHLEIGIGTRSNLYHICEYAEKLENAKAKIEPVNEPIQLINARYYCPINFTEFYGEPDCDDSYEDDYYTGDGEFAARYENEIKEALEKEHSYDGCDEKSMARYQDNSKVRAVRFDVENINGNLYGCIKTELSAPFTASEEQEFKSWLTGQCSDGFGEGFEQSEIETNEGYGYCRFWDSGNDWFMKNENDFRNYLNQKNDINLGGM